MTESHFPRTSLEIQKFHLAVKLATSLGLGWNSEVLFALQLGLHSVTTDCFEIGLNNAMISALQIILVLPLSLRVILSYQIG